MPSEGAKGVPQVTIHSSCRSCTGLSSWVMDLNFSGSSGVLSAGARGWWELVTSRCCALSSNSADTNTPKGWDRCQVQAWAKPPYSRAFRSELVFKEMNFEGKEPTRTSWIAGGKKPTLCSCP